MGAAVSGLGTIKKAVNIDSLFDGRLNNIIVLSCRHVKSMLGRFSYGLALCRDRFQDLQKSPVL